MAAPFVPVPVPIDRVSQSGRRGSTRTTPLEHSPSKPNAKSIQECTQSGLEQPGSLERGILEDLRNKGLSQSGTEQNGVLEDLTKSNLKSDLKSLEDQECSESRTTESEASCVSLFSSTVDRTSTPGPYGSSAPGSLGDQAHSGSGWPFTPTVLGYEVMEERAKFTVYKVLVRKSVDESWVVFRRYTDFARLNDKLKDSFPGFRLSLPPKRWFKDNYEADFLHERTQRLQSFLQNLIAHRDVAQCGPVREFLCLDDPPGPFDSLEESRAFCETLEECNYRLQKELLEKQREIHNLRRVTEEQQRVIDTLQERISSVCVSPPADLSLDAESSAAEADQRHECSKQAACWCVPVIRSPLSAQIHTSKP